VDELAMLSEIVARRVAFTFRPITPAFSEEEMVIISILEVINDYTS
jgi:hypothetical protein